MRKSHIEMNRPIVVGMYVLELSKVLMYNFLYNYLKPKYMVEMFKSYIPTPILSY